METAVSINQLRITSNDGSPSNEYRISDGRIEFRALDSEGNPFTYSQGKWRLLDPADLQLHFALNTVVAQWLTERLPTMMFRSSPPARA
jgi:hypothetical protein